jgi:hypothetical protein
MVFGAVGIGSSTAGSGSSSIGAGSSGAGSGASSIGAGSSAAGSGSSSTGAGSTGAGSGATVGVPPQARIEARMAIAAMIENKYLVDMFVSFQCKQRKYAKYKTDDKKSQESTALGR